MGFTQNITPSPENEPCVDDPEANGREVGIDTEDCQHHAINWSVNKLL